MIVCHQYRFIFIKTQKTAGTSLEIALSGLCSPSDIVTPISRDDEEYRKSLGVQSPTNYFVPFKNYTRRDILNFILSNKRKQFYNHISCLELRQFLGAGIFDSYYKFCFERNPYDKLLSLFFHQGGYEKWGAVQRFIESGGLNIIKGFDQYTIDKIVAVDDIFKFEEIGKALEIISQKLKLDQSLELPPVKLKSQFRKDRTHYSLILNEVEKKLIDVIWARERELMGYKF